MNTTPPEQLGGCMPMFALALLLMQGPAAAGAPRTAGWCCRSRTTRTCARRPIRRAEPEPPPVASVVTRVDYDLKVGGRLGGGRGAPHGGRAARGLGAVAASGRAAGARGAAGRAAGVAGRPGQQRRGAPAHLPSRPGRSVITLESWPRSSPPAAPRRSRPRRGARRSRGRSLSVPRQGVDVASPAASWPRRRTRPGPQRVVAHGRAGESLVARLAAQGRGAAGGPAAAPARTAWCSW